MQMNKLNYEELILIIEILIDRAKNLQFVLDLGELEKNKKSRIEKKLYLINSSIEKLTKEKEYLLYEED